MFFCHVLDLFCCSLHWGANPDEVSRAKSAGASFGGIYMDYLLNVTRAFGDFVVKTGDNVNHSIPDPHICM